MPVNSEQQRERRYCLFPTGQLFHVAEALHGRHGVVLDTSCVGFLKRVE